MGRSRRSYGFWSKDGFWSKEMILEHIDGVKTISDLSQLAFDIDQSGKNLASIRRLPALPLWAFDYAVEIGPFQRHLFLEPGCSFVPEIGLDCDSFSQLTD